MIESPDEVLARCALGAVNALPQMQIELEILREKFNAIKDQIDAFNAIIRVYELRSKKGKM